MVQFFDDSYCRCRTLAAGIEQFPCPCAAKRLVRLRLKFQIRHGSFIYKTYRLGLQIRFIVRKFIAQQQRRTLS